MIDVEKTIISQYQNSPILIKLIQNFNAYIDPSKDIEAFLSLIWNVNTANSYGLDIWGQIVNVSRILTIEATPDYLGFKNSASDWQPFGQAVFFAGDEATTSYRLSDDAYRTLIMVKALTNISRATSGTINTLLTNLFSDRGRCYVMDDGDMRMHFVFEFALESYELAIITSSGVFPRPSGVKCYVLPSVSNFGFQTPGNEYEPFGQGVFFTRNLIEQVQ